MKIVFLLLALGVFFASAKKQSVRVKGRLLCRELPEQYAELQLIDKWMLFPNTVMARDKFSDPSGFFEIAGFVDSKFDVKVALHIWHHCYEHPAEHKDPCQLKIKVPIPPIFVQDGATSPKAWDLGDIALDTYESKLTSCD
ncbi:unnamed protein product [Caenorhabditis sp. 36 PRJEB53466]|nr:unnamed protein product [Caenorhabditis sp. 36 PRJEB53466]